jgi:hypothetical protein
MVLWFLHLIRKGKAQRSLILMIHSFLESSNVAMSSLPTEEHYVGFEVLTAVVMKSSILVACIALLFPI